MTVDTVSMFLALLALIAQATAIAGALLLVARHVSRRVDRWAALLVDQVGPHALALAFAVATTATVGSLYFSEVAHFTPCQLCWYQRICMYPLVPILGLAAVRRDHGVRPYAAALALIGAVVASYHVLLERFPTLESNVCDPNTPCTVIWVNRFGYLTIPAMALSGFALVLTLLATARPPRNSAP